VNCAPNLLIPGLGDVQPATVGYPTDRNVGEVAETPGTFNFEKEAASQFAAGYRAKQPVTSALYIWVKAKQDRKCTYNGTLRRVRGTNFAVENQ